MEEMQSDSPLQTVDRCLRLLQLFTPEQPEWAVADAARALGISKSMVSRLFTALSARGFAEQDSATRRYRLGLALIALGQVAHESLDLNQAALPVMRQLSEQTGEAVFLTVVDGDTAVTIEKVENHSHPLRLSLNLGTRSPLHAGASHTVLLAFLPEEKIEAYLSRPLSVHTPITVSDPGDLRRRLAEIRRRGYDFSKGELTPGVGAIGVPVFGPGRALVAALSIGFPVTRVDERALPGLVTALRSAAARISHRLGYTAEVTTT